VEFPFSSSTIIAERRKIKKALLAQHGEQQKIKLAILGGSTTSEIRHVLEIFLLDQGFDPEFYESDYNQYFADAVFDNPNLTAFEPDLVYVHTTHVNIARWPDIGMTPDEVDSLLYEEFNRYQILWKKIGDSLECPIIQNNFDLPAYRALGNLDSILPQGRVHFIQQLNAQFAQASRETDNLYVQDINYLASVIGLDKWWDSTFYFAYKYALSYEAIPHLAFNLVNMIRAIYGKSKKCLIVDLDDTLWGGSIGEDGLTGIEIGRETPIAEAHTALQEYIVLLRARGIVLAVCSKNDRENALLGLSHASCVLNANDFAAIKANWNAKSKNLVQIAEEINLGLDSFVFLDDNPVERDIVKRQVPEVAVPNIGGDIENFLRILDRSGYFEVVTIHDDDMVRAKNYRGNIQRQEFERQFEDYGSYLDSLEMEAEIREFDTLHLERITQLTNKTNQFNLTSKRFRISDMKHFGESDQYLALYGRLKDKFGDNGITSVMVGEIRNDGLHVILWLMSCRVFKRDFEYALFDTIVELCNSKGIKRIIGYYVATGKNAIVKNLYSELGFNLVDEQEGGKWNWEMPEEYKCKNSHIKVNS
jgi:FkbH-like protein